ncbi:hypothetical protein DHW03_13695 [Pedobacter yonginense]|uniref:Uncharacterized protein n=1 Tax=Pedobacter yonginense TaxID=651869 RepID=A0A317EJP5_9SPHI|nr:hypothetical protein DHW03_13695 [Pedobacter yonginense]
MSVSLFRITYCLSTTKSKGIGLNLFQGFSWFLQDIFFAPISHIIKGKKNPVLQKQNRILSLCY